MLSCKVIFIKLLQIRNLYFQSNELVHAIHLRLSFVSSLLMKILVYPTAFWGRWQISVFQYWIIRQIKAFNGILPVTTHRENHSALLIHRPSLILILHLTMTHPQAVGLPPNYLILRARRIRKRDINRSKRFMLLLNLYFHKRKDKAPCCVISLI